MLHVSERELQRILLDIHDGPVQYMYAALSQIELLRRALATLGVDGDPAVRDRLERITRLLESGLHEVRSFIGAFRPPEFEQHDLRTLLEGLVVQHESTTDTQVAFDAPAALPSLDLAAKIALYRVLQEGLSNAYRHGGGDRVLVRLRVLGDGAARLRLEISDNGAGFEMRGLTREQRFGLEGMRDRMAMVGGSFDLRSAPGAGTTVTVEVPAA
jgi:signal transduction histidine kinase